jgi:hypothetical protein
MKLKLPPLLILWLLIRPPMSYTQTPPELPDGQSSGYGIESEKLYPGTMILDLLAAAEAEIDAAVDEAYAEGYKAASLRFAPEIERLKAHLNALPSPSPKTTPIKDRLLFGLGGFVLGAVSVGVYHLVPK